jgi:hypothetical protein
VVLTVDPTGFGDRWDAFGAFYRLWQDRLRKRLERFARRYAAAGERLEYVMTFERTAQGWPHANVLIGHPGLDTATDVHGLEVRRKGRARRGRWCELPKWRRALVSMVTGSGFGRVVWLERVRSSEAWAAYVTKLAMELVGAGEKGQTPYGAPKGFRRLRSTRGTLPPTFASIRRAEGGMAERAWAMTSKLGLAAWGKLPKHKVENLSKSIFRSKCTDADSRLFMRRQSALEGVLSARTSTDYAELVQTWIPTFEETSWRRRNDRGATPPAASA